MNRPAVPQMPGNTEAEEQTLACILFSPHTIGRVMDKPQIDIATFARSVLGKPLYPYQLEVAEAILDSVWNGRGRIFTVMMARQSGKNQLSATLEAYLLYTCSEGTIIKAAPTFSPKFVPVLSV